MMSIWIKVLFGVLLFNACGKKEDPSPEPSLAPPQTRSNPTADQSALPPSPSPSIPPDQVVAEEPATEEPTPVEEPADQAVLWVASNSIRGIVGLNLKGDFVTMIDFSNALPTGSVTALSFVDHDTLLAFLDPGLGSERIARIDLDGDKIASVNTNWHQDTTNLNATTLYSMVIWSASKILFGKAAALVEAASFSLDANVNLAVRIGNPWINTGLTGTATCLLTLIQSLEPLRFGSTRQLLALSSGVNSRLNIYSGIDEQPSCASSLNFVSGSISASHIPVGAAQVSDTHVFVRYQATTNPLIVRYTYDGTNLSSPTTVLSDASVLNRSISDRVLYALDSQNLLFSNWGNDSIYKFNISTGTASIFLRSLWTTDVNSLALRPD